ncbi:erythrocyte membrane protein 1, PfEMP1, putative [Plasmodium reichenowi]|uniref:Erythrocyte membrane protein 1, PfEMP1, putative n=1 Tax=Plasmodium reichenowi TaxID=5854 RepID=A0A2P9D5L4_PLARE|nr:erythrocyte membrane protein 1, PfEMP1, putative [Plasmodium reichenowi]
MVVARGGGGGGGNADKEKEEDKRDYIYAKDAKNFLDIIGEKVYKEKVKSDAETYKDKLKGDLNKANKSSEETASSLNPCKLVEQYISGGAANGNRYPCGNTTGTGEVVNRFSDKEGAECANNRIDGNIKNSNDKDFGACAPYRRLSLCNKNFQKINNYDSNMAKHNLLVEVCLAAHYEGESLKHYSEQYDEQYPGSGSTMCTMLARSFADIGDIVRGRDLYLGKKKKNQTERDKLEKKLKDIFKNIYDNLMEELSMTKKNGQEELQERYKDTENYYELREDWWALNRQDVWKAMTCKADHGNIYFRGTCGSDGKNSSLTPGYCRCGGDQPGNDKPNIDPPTYFDYVPQYLRWFEEWAEDFCRKKNKKIKDVKQQCRGKHKEGNDRYCSRNGFDCEKTKRAIGRLRYGKQCISCLYACNPYVEWIDNQRKQFDKQRNIYEDEISGRAAKRRRRNARSSKGYEGYEQKFYDELKNNSEFRTVNYFLEKLSNETDCQKVEDKEGGTINFKENHDKDNNDKNKGTFYHSQYCQPCPHCGVKKNKNGGSGKQWEEKSTNDNCNIKRYAPKSGKDGTRIEILKSGEGKEEIKQKIDEFCQKPNGNTANGSVVVASGAGGRGANGVAGNSDSKELYEEWKCYKHEELQQVGEGEVDLEYDQEIKDAGGLCILQNTKKNETGKAKKSEPEPDQFQKTFNDFFNFWVAHMLKDSIHWRTEKLKGCIKTGKKTCLSKCKEYCECYEKWIDKKKQEWQQVKQHYEKENNMGIWSPYYVLEMNLQNDYFPSIKGSYKGVEFVDEIENIIEKFKGKEIYATNEDNSINQLLKQELDEAQKCEKCKNPLQDRSAGRAILTRSDPVDEDPALGSEDEEEEDEDEDEVEENHSVEDQVEDVSPQVPSQDNVNVCSIVHTLFTTPNSLDAACSQKYGKNAPSSWKCIPTGNGSSNTSEGSSDGGGRAKRSTSGPDSPTVDKGAICVPPRRRRLYIGKIKEWADKQMGKTQDKDGDKQVEGQGNEATAQPNGHADTSGSEQSSTSTSPTPEDPPEASLRRAFVESAAVETFFLWHNYKEQWRLENGGGSQVGVDGPRGIGVGVGGSSYDSSESFGPFRTSGLGMQAQLGGPNGVPGLGVAPGIGPGGMQGARAKARLGQEDLAEDPGALQPGPNGLPPDFSGVVKAVSMPSSGSPGLIFQDLDGESSPRSRLQRFGDASQLSLTPLVSSDSSENPSDPNDPNNIYSGEIPPPFLRQMFYTIADYRDILVGKTPEGIDEVTVSVGSGSDKDKEGDRSGKVTMEEIKKAIETFFKNGGDKPSSSGSSSGKDPSSWWDKNAKHIWEGMVCSLTYKDNSETQAIGQATITQDDALKEALLDSSGKPKKTADHDYTYGGVTIGGNDNVDGPKPHNGGIVGTPTPPSNGITLAEFVTRPAYFRWLEEWGDDFCKKRTEKLKEVKKACRENNTGDDTLCSGDGHDCTDKDAKYNKMFTGIDCRDCYKHCRKYRKWIDLKFEEFHNQKSKYGKELQKLKDNCSGDNTCCEEIKNYDSAANFLASLKHCKPGEDNSEKKGTEEEKNKVNFDDLKQTFSRSTYCETCPPNIVKCNSGGSRRSGVGNDPCTPDNRNEKTWDTVFNGNDDKTTITVEMIDRRGPFIKEYLNKSGNSGNSKNSFKDSYLFKGVRTQEWKCTFNKEEKMDVCKLDKFEKKIDLNDYTTFKVLLEYWLEDFLYGYYLLKKRKIIEKCTKNGGNTCDVNSKNDCACVKKWLEIKRNEWKEIQNYFKKRKQEDDEAFNIEYKVKTFFQELIPQIAPTNDKEHFKTLDSFLRSYACKCAENSEKGEDADKKDIVDCMIKDLETKIGECTSQTTGQTPSNCVDTLTHVEDVDDDPLEEIEENTVTQPGFCPEQSTKEEEKDEDGCEPAADEKEEEKQKEEPGADSDTAPTEPAEAPGNDQADKSPKPPEDKAQPATPNLPKPQPNPPLPQPKTSQYTPSQWRDVMSASAFPWTVGVAFVALTYWFIKKKTKSSVDLLRVMEIPQNDYGMPTTKSSNRYIPYASGKYRGKRYIYLEGDSGTDSGYTDHYSDITSSSESEYEELDINDIYVPGSPKYKTLIEVVLEPSKRDTLSGNIQNDIPNDNTPSNKLTDIEWNELKQNFISNMFQNDQKDQNDQNDIPNNNISGNSPTNTNNTTMSRHNVDNNTHPTMSHYNVDNNIHPTPSRHNVDNNTHPTPSHNNVDNNTHPTPSRDTLDQKPFIMSIHDRNLYTGEEYNYDMENSGETNIYSSISPTSGENNLYSDIDTINGNNDLYSGQNNLYSDVDSTSDKNGPYSDNPNPISDNRDSYSDKNGPYSGIDLINDSLNSDQHIDIYDEILKRKENELFGTKHHPKRTTGTHNVAKAARDDPIHNQLELFHKWLDRHRNMCEKWDKNNKKEELLDKLKEEWNKDNNSGNKTSGNITPNSDNTPPNSDIPTGKLSGIPSDNNIHSDIHPSDIPSGKISDIPSGDNIPSDTPSDNNIHSDIQTSNIPSGKLSDILSSNKMLNSDVSIQIHMDNPKTTNIVDINPDNSSMDTILADLDKTYNESYYDIYEDDKPSVDDNVYVDSNNMDVPSKVKIEMSVKNTQMMEKKYPIGDVWDI